ncbi:MAG: PIN domain-containing protein [Pseudanabaenales cyanobacterium]|nr:PIN domain-containing protein [Pseudanabaenales cyanobacterium]
MYLIDTNIWLERLLEQQQSDVVGEFLSAIPSDQLMMTDFTLHSIALALTRRKLYIAFNQFLQDTFIDGSVGLLTLQPGDLSSVLTSMESQRLDYDDAYQYVVAEYFNLTIISFDSDFDRTLKGRKIPVDILQFRQSTDPNE